jgi:hypothetical protein
MASVVEPTYEQLNGFAKEKRKEEMRERERGTGGSTHKEAMCVKVESAPKQEAPRQAVAHTCALPRSCSTAVTTMIDSALAAPPPVDGADCVCERGLEGVHAPKVAAFDFGRDTSVVPSAVGDATVPDLKVSQVAWKPCKLLQAKPRAAKVAATTVPAREPV